jgi:hypothetical protein
MTQDYSYSHDSPVTDPVDAGVFGPVGGGFLHLQLNGSVGVGVEVLYIQKGFESTYVATDAQGVSLGERTDHYKAHYLSVPVTARYEFETGDRQLHVFAGLSGEILLSHDEIFDYLTSSSFGGLVGIGFVSNRFGVNVRYVRDLTDSADPGPTATLQSVKNYGFLALVSYALWR